MDEKEQVTTQWKAKTLCSRAGFFCFLLAIFGIYRIFDSGLSLNHKLYTYVPIFLGFLGSFGATFYGMTVCSNDEPLRGWGIALSKFAGLLPYVAGMYMVFFLGLYGIYTIMTEFTTLTLLRSLFFSVFGYKCLFYFWAASEMDKQDLSQPFVEN